jgi:uncharacterized protein (TIGR03643 family)
MAWEDRTAFETIQERMGWTEADVIRLMRHELQPSSFRMWRKRMTGRTTKHRALRSIEMKFDDSRPSQSKLLKQLQTHDVISDLQNNHLFIIAVHMACSS